MSSLVTPRYTELPDCAQKSRPLDMESSCEYAELRTRGHPGRDGIPALGVGGGPNNKHKITKRYTGPLTLTESWHDLNNNNVYGVLNMRG
jgi:hypothetical protein